MKKTSKKSTTKRSFLKRLTPKRLLILIIAIAVIAVAIAFVTKKNTVVSTGNIYYTPASLSSEKDKDLNVTIRVTPGTKIDTVTAGLKFDPEQLQYKSVSYQDSPFTTQIPATTTSDTVTVQSALLGGGTIEADSLIAVVTFTAKSSGKPSITLSGNTALAGSPLNPRISGKIIDRPDRTQANATKTSTPIVDTASSLLRSFGVPADKSRTAAVWTIIFLIFVILAIIGTIVIHFFQKRIHKK